MATKDSHDDRASREQTAIQNSDNFLPPLFFLIQWRILNKSDEQIKNEKENENTKSRVYSNQDYHSENALQESDITIPSSIKELNSSLE